MYKRATISESSTKTNTKKQPATKKTAVGNASPGADPSRKMSYNDDVIDPLSIGERALWRAVITQTLMDAASNSSKTIDKVEKARALAWFSLGNPDFITVCAYADFDPRYVLERAKEAIKQGCKWRKEPQKKPALPAARRAKAIRKKQITRKQQAHAE